MNCEKCGELLPEDAEFCPKCAEEEAERELETVQEEERVSEETAPVKGISKKMLYGIIGGCVAVVALIVILCVAFSGSKFPIKAGMNIVEVHEALTDEGFVLQEDYDLYDEEKMYDGFIDGIGVVTVRTEFNDVGKLTYVGISGGGEKAIPKYFLKEFGGYSTFIFKYPAVDIGRYGDVVLDGYTRIEPGEKFWLCNKDDVQSIMKDSWVGFFFEEYLPEETRNELNDFINEIR